MAAVPKIPDRQLQQGQAEHRVERLVERSRPPIPRVEHHGSRKASARTE